MGQTDSLPLIDGTFKTPEEILALLFKEMNNIRRLVHNEEPVKLLKDLTVKINIYINSISTRLGINSSNQEVVDTLIELKNDILSAMETYNSNKASFDLDKQSNTVLIESILNETSYLKTRINEILNSLENVDLSELDRDILYLETQLPIIDISKYIDMSQTICNKPLTDDIVINNTDVGLDTVLNKPLLSKLDYRFRLHQVVNNADSADVLLIEDASAGYNKKHIKLNTLPVSNVVIADLSNKVPISRTVNSYPLESNITLNKGDLDLSNVLNLADIDLPITSIEEAVLSSKTNKVSSVVPGVYGSASKTIILTYNDNGLITEITDTDIQVLPENSGFENIKNVDTTNASNVYVNSSPLITDEVLVGGESVTEAFGKIEGRTNACPLQVNNSVSNELIISDSSGNLISSGIKVMDSEYTPVNILTAVGVDALVQSRISNEFNIRGSFNASLGAYPSTGGSGINGVIRKYDMWVVSTTGTVNNTVYRNGNMIYATKNSPGINDWNYVTMSLGYMAEDVANKDIDTLSSSKINYPSNNAAKEYIDTQLLSYQSKLDGSPEEYIDGTGTTRLLDKDAIGLDHVLNKDAFPAYADDFRSLDLKGTPVPADVLIIEDKVTGVKRKAVLSSLPVSSDTQLISDSLVDKTTSVNGKELYIDVELSAADFGLGSVNNTSDINKPLSILQTQSLNSKLDKINRVPVTIGSADKTLVIEYNNNGQITDVTEADITITGSDIGLDQVKNIDTTLQSNVKLLDIDPLTEAVPIEVNDSGEAAFNKLIAQIKTKHVKFPAGGLSNELVSLTSEGYMKNSGYTINDTIETEFNLLTTTGVKNKINTILSSAFRFVGLYDASTNAFPLSGSGGGSIQVGDLWILSQGGTMGGNTFTKGDSIYAKTLLPGQDILKWGLLENKLQYIPENISNKSQTITADDTKYPSNTAVSAYMSASLPDLQPVLSQSDSSSFLDGSQTFAPLTKLVYNLDKVDNTVQLSSDADDFRSFPEQTVVSTNDKLLAEEAANNWNKIHFKVSNIPAPSGLSGLAEQKVDITAKLNNTLVLDNNPTLTKAHIVLSNVSDISDTDMPVSTVQSSVINTKVPKTRTINTKVLDSDINITSTDISDLSNVDNTSDLDKPISTAQSVLLDTKASTQGTLTDQNLVQSTSSGAIEDSGYHVSDTVFTESNLLSAEYILALPSGSVGTGLSFKGPWVAGSVLKDEMYNISTNTSIGGRNVFTNDVIITKIDSPTSSSDWVIMGRKVPDNVTDTTDREETSMNTIEKYPSSYLTKTHIDSIVSDKMDIITPAVDGALVKYNNSNQLLSSPYTVSTSFNPVSITDIPTSDLVSDLLDGKQETVTGAMTTVLTTDLPPNRAVISSAAGKITESVINAPEVGYVSGTIRPVQTDMDSRMRTITYTVQTEFDLIILVNAKVGDIAINEGKRNELFLLIALPPTTLLNWKPLRGYSEIDTRRLPNLSFTTYNFHRIRNYFLSISAHNRQNPPGLLKKINGGVQIGTNSTYGGTYVPDLNRVYFSPHSGDTTWFYFDLTTNTTETFTGPDLGVNSMTSMVYVPTVRKAYYIPHKNNSLWYYINTTNGDLVSYSPNATLNSFAYAGGAFSPKQNRIYLAPYGQATSATWHYIDCTNDTVVPYTHGQGSITSVAYIGASYIPLLNRIYLGPNAPALTTWHYIDCNTGNVMSYNKPPNIVGNYNTGVYSPIGHKLYFIPTTINTTDPVFWPYIDCDTGIAGTYPAVSVGNSAYQGGVYDPGTGRIYFCPRLRLAESTLHYIDTFTDTANTYPNPFVGQANPLACTGGVYLPDQEWILFCPRKLSPSSELLYLDVSSGTKVSKQITTSCLFNNY